MNKTGLKRIVSCHGSYDVMACAMSFFLIKQIDVGKNVLVCALHVFRIEPESSGWIDIYDRHDKEISTGWSSTDDSIECVHTRF